MTGKGARVVLGVVLGALAAMFAIALTPTAAVAGAGVRAETSAPYPPVFCPTISISTTHPFPGQEITITGQGFDGVQALTLVMTPGDFVLGHVSTTAAGTFSTTVKLPAGVTGNRVIRATGSGSDCPVDPIQIDVAGPTHKPQPPLGSTGVDILTGIVVALGLIGIGLALTRGGRRKYRGVHVL